MVQVSDLVSSEMENRLRAEGIKLVAGIDEAGRGPLAGPVVAAAVVFERDREIIGVDDSKKITPIRRDLLFEMIVSRAATIGIGIVSSAMIDELNIYQATMKAMRLAVSDLSVQPGHLLVDGPRYHDSSIPFTAIIGGDATCFSIAAASIIAKVTRDRIMVGFDSQYPQYGFAKHKGYGTAEHFAAIRKFGPCEIHRRTFRMPAQEGHLHG